MTFSDDRYLLYDAMCNFLPVLGPQKLQFPQIVAPDRAHPDSKGSKAKACPARGMTIDRLKLPVENNCDLPYS